MGEVEEQIANEGLPAIDDKGRDECCEGAELRGYRCEWSIDRVVLPGDMGGGEGEEGEDGEGGLPGMGEGDAPALAMGDFLGGGSDTSGLAEMAIGLAYPVLKPHIEEQVRRVTVEVFWTEGETERSFDVVQYVVGESGVAVTVVFPGGVATSIATNSGAAIPGGGDKTAKMTMTLPTAAAAQIIAGAQKGSFRVVIGKDARAMDVLARVSPRRATEMIAKKMKALLGH